MIQEPCNPRGYDVGAGAPENWQVLHQACKDQEAQKKTFIYATAVFAALWMSTAWR